MQNVGTAVAIKRAIIDGHPLIERVVTVTGEAIQQPGNFWARLGTPVQYLLQQAGFQPQDQQMVIMGAINGLYPARPQCAYRKNQQLPVSAYRRRNGA